MTFENKIRLPKWRQKVLNGFESKTFPTGKQTQGKGIKILTSKQMLQGLPIALVQVKAVNTFKYLFNKIRKIIYSSDRAKEITKYYTTK